MYFERNLGEQTCLKWKYKNLMISEARRKRLTFTVKYCDFNLEFHEVKSKLYPCWPKGNRLCVLKLKCLWYIKLKYFNDSLLLPKYISNVLRLKAEMTCTFSRFLMKVPNYTMKSHSCNSNGLCRIIVSFYSWSI